MMPTLLMAGDSPYRGGETILTTQKNGKGTAFFQFRYAPND